MLEPGNTIHGFIVESTEELSEIDGSAIVMNHEHSGAKLLYLKNDDENKAFSITFKTPPADNTGVFHILEHSVLCGSEQFPVKEPYVNLLRTSMQTFLNALTFPDKTMYPVASTNETDLLHLMDVYMDAVLNPMLYIDKHIFEQEGWHYELVDAAGQAGAEMDEAGATAAQDQSLPEMTLDQEADTAPGQEAKQLIYNGVVFNEMKGALSDPEEVLLHALNRALFADSCYAFDSGGNPRAIPQLTYESYCDTHARHYRLDNSYIVLYGDMDIDRVLGFLDTKYLGAGADGAPRREAAFAPPNPLGEIHPVRSFDNKVKMLTTPDNATVGLGYVVGSSHDFERVLAVDILLDALMGGNESPIKRVLLDAQIGGDCTAALMESQLAPVALFMLKNAKPGAAEAFRTLIEDEAQRLVREGIPRDILQASLAQMSFYLRERDRGIADGVVLAMSALSGWLYDDQDATTYLHFEEPLARMREGLDKGYFEDVLASLVLESTHAALVDLQPVAAAEESEEAAELAATQAGMSDDELSAIEADLLALRARQEAPDSPEALATLPQLHVSDIGPAKKETEPVLRTDTPLPCLYHQLATRHIIYLNLYFDLAHLTWEDVPYISVLCPLLGNLDTRSHTAAELDVYTRQHLGSLRFVSEVLTDYNDPNQLSFKLRLKASALSEEIEYLAAITQEVMTETIFDDADRIRDVLVQRRIAIEESFVSDGHIRAMARAGSYLHLSGVLTDQFAGVNYYLFLKDLIEHFDEHFDALRERLQALCKRIFVTQACTASFTGSPEDCERFWQLAGTLGLSAGGVSDGAGTAGGAADVVAAADGTVDGIGIDDGPLERNLVIPAPVLKREAFATPTDVCFTAKAADLGPVDYDGNWIVLGRVMGYDYLWNEVRVKGGAYGCGFRGNRSGHVRFFSYRDPQLDDTIARFDGAGEWLTSFDPDADEMEGYIVSAVATHDAPQKPRAIARRQDIAYFTHQPPHWRTHLRDTLLSVSPESIRALAPRLDEIAQSEAVCVFGNAAIAEASSADFEIVRLLDA